MLEERMRAPHECRSTRTPFYFFCVPIPVDEESYTARKVSVVEQAPLPLSVESPDRSLERSETLEGVKYS